ncbi:DeoR/GlpR family DNA-binding transcription regulator [Comamonas composti]|uniref:DeoR/GlpR family DNA-binding transcription regulator n=1 Tax=Comamonas composti TaxID=408558 RepID=UPI00040E2E6C|nr:DeoR/GlpR family DNA-binding transcription regulator [Comamonas composti]
MNETERQHHIVEALKKHPFSTVKDLMAVVDASAATIRRDILKLHAAGAVRKVFGGIASIDGLSSRNRLSARPFDERLATAVDEKKAIAAEAEKLCRDGDSVIISGGSTCHLLAQRLTTRSLKIYTNSMPVSTVLSEKGLCQLVVAGGELHRESGILYSQLPDALPFYASRCFIGTQGIGPDGAMESHPMLIQSIQRLIKMSDELVLLADSRKFSIRARHIAVPLSRIATLITDDRISESDVRMMENEGVSVVTTSVMTSFTP